MEKNLHNQRIYQKIAAQIRSWIESGRYRPGDALPGERDLAAQLQVSRTSVREAVIALEVSGLVEVRIGSGVYVRAAQPDAAVDLTWQKDPELSAYLPDPEEVSPFSLLQARLLIEPETAFLAAEHLTPAALKAIKEAYLMNVEDNLQNSTSHIGDRLFHIRIAEASGNDAYAMILRELLGHRYGQLFSTLQRLYTPQDMPMRSQQEHLAVLMAIEQRNPEAARRHMTQHIRNVIQIFLRSHQTGTETEADIESAS